MMAAGAFGPLAFAANAAGFVGALLGAPAKLLRLIGPGSWQGYCQAQPALCANIQPLLLPILRLLLPVVFLWRVAAASYLGSCLVSITIVV